MSVNGADLTEQDYLDIAEAAVAAARQAGAEEAEAAVGAGNDFSATVRQGKTEKLLESGSKGLSLRVFVGGRAASVSTSDFAPDAIRRAASDAVDLAKISDPDECGGLPEAGFGLSADPDDLETYDPATAKLTPERLIEWAGRAEQAAFDGPRSRDELGWWHGRAHHDARDSGQQPRIRRFLSAQLLRHRH